MFELNTTSASGEIAVSCNLLAHRLVPKPHYLPDAALKHLLRSELTIPLHLNSAYVPERITLTTERLKQALKETSSREILRSLKDSGDLTEERLEQLVTLLNPLNEMMHFFWRRVDVVRSEDKHLAIHWGLNTIDINTTLTGVVTVKLTLHYRKGKTVTPVEEQVAAAA